MLSQRYQRRVWIGLGILAGALAAVMALALAAVVYNYYGAADYPGAMLVSDHSLYRLAPALHFRRDTSYRSTDEFPKLYNWYSGRFELGPEARAISACITLEKADTLLIVERQTTVMLCDTERGRLIFVMRALTLRYR